MIQYEYPHSGAYNETRATLPDGRKVTINPQYGAVTPLWDHELSCPQLVQFGGRCTCEANADIMAQADALVADARAHGKFGAEPMVAPEPNVDLLPSHACPRCNTYCDGDCAGGAR